MSSDRNGESVSMEEALNIYKQHGIEANHFPHAPGLFVAVRDPSHVAYLLRYGHVTSIEVTAHPLAAESLKRVFSIPGVEALDVMAATLRGSDFTGIEAMETLRKLFVGRLFYKGDLAMERISRCRHLESLELVSSIVSPDGFACLQNTPSLRRLSVYRCVLGHDSWSAIGRLTKLTNLAAVDPYLTHTACDAISELGCLWGLSLAYSYFYGRPHFAALSSLAALRELELYYTNVDAQDVPGLKQLHNLEYLDLTATRIPDSDFQKLRKALPKCEMTHSFWREAPDGRDWPTWNEEQSKRQYFRRFLKRYFSGGSGKQHRQIAQRGQGERRS